MYFKFKYKTNGGHTHYRLFAGNNEFALGLAGPSQTLRNEEWEAFKYILEAGTIPDLDTAQEINLEQNNTVEFVEQDGWLW